MNLREARKKAELTQVEVSELAGIPQSHFSSIESGKMFPLGQTRKKIESAIGIPIDWVKTRLQGKRTLTFKPDGHVAGENGVMAAVSEYVQSGQRKERTDRFRFLKDFIKQYERALREDQREQDEKLKKGRKGK
jgi:transcriptional regulator with XRE-family HTH domain